VTSLDLFLLCAVLLATLGVGMAGARPKADSDDFLLAGRSLPWWAAGTSMVATTFAVDTPLAVAGVTATQGISGNWFWWGLIVSHVLITFGLAARWRATECTTDAEVVALRYGEGKSARTLRRLRALYFMGPINLFVLGWVLHAGAKVLGALIPFHRWVATETLNTLAWGSLDGAAVLGLLVSLAIALAYGTVAGLRGVVWTDLLQFGLAMGGALVLAWTAYTLCGGGEGLAALIDARQQGIPQADIQILAALNPLDPHWVQASTIPQHGALDLMGGHTDLVLTALILSWWANKNADGGGVLVQRMLACKSRRDATLAMAWFTAAHYLLRPWAWLMVGLVVGVLFALPPESGFEQSYPDAMLTLLSPGILGLALGGMVAALVSTADTHLHWGASYVANDLLPTHSDSDTKLRWSRWVQPPMAAIAALVAAHLGSIAAAWKVLLVLGAGLGAPTLLRWYIRRLDATTELIAFGASTVTAFLVLWGPWARPSFAWQMALVGSTGLVVCIAGAWRAQTTDQADAFMERTNVVPADWVLWGLAGLACLLGAAAGARHALTGSSLGLIAFLGGLIAYAVLVYRFTRGIPESDQAFPGLPKEL
jgi:Na+/proline symporter